MNTVRTYYRNAVMAFPNTTEYACAITRPPSRFVDKVIVLTMCVGAVVAIVAAIFVGPAV